MQTKIEKGHLIIAIPVAKEPQPSKSGKSLVVATTNGFVVTEAKLNGKNIRISINAIL